MQHPDFSPISGKLIEFRRHLHGIPEIGLSEIKTPAFIAERLKTWGYKVHRGIAATGLVASLERGRPLEAIGFRADFDALPMDEATGLTYASRHPGAMHACGHDGHTTMLLGAAWALAQDRAFDGTVHFIFQPAEENLGGAKLMIDDGIFDRFPCQRIFALHNLPGLAAGSFATRAGAIAASIDVVTITVKGKGGHGALPETTIDPVVVGSSIVMALQTLVSRNVSPHERSVVTVGAFRAGSAANIIPDVAVLEVSMRATNAHVRRELQRRIEDVATFQARSFNAEVDFTWEVGYPATVNDPAAVDLAARSIVKHFGEHAFTRLESPMMFSEDFSFMLERVPGAYILIGNGDSSGLHSSTYDFNDAILERGSALFYHLAKDDEGLGDR
ncbi:amidohydrolase (plasmid) [Rhizobium leguminosarum bv. trifolii WSM2304]|uniref:Amidohydrolase n=1 Tax=Rhizobium leguminosarum bv. trifolii (strain WSM2304) TaxID=395492 RepID=A0ABF7QW64_RHILW|nr:M20 aminoacylase family protein [Rhizobium leguminosarum]ACI58289.1 amidohydrolase [Rhizobium leguminosarum bv. trifolii WSM2304]